MVSYYESAEGVEISKKRALIELRKHGIDFEEFFRDLGDHETYDAQAVLEWLGY
jgi:hypothetical protein